MPDFENYLRRHGESWVQDIIERMERFEGIRGRATLPLKDRWIAVMSDATNFRNAAAA